MVGKNSLDLFKCKKGIRTHGKIIIQTSTLIVI